MLHQQPALRLVQGRPHQCHDRGEARLIYLQAVEETFYYDDRWLPRSDSSMQIEQHLRFGKARRKSVPRLASIQTAAAIAHQSASFIINGDHQALAHPSRPGIEADAEFARGRLADPSRGHIGMA